MKPKRRRKFNATAPANENVKQFKQIEDAWLGISIPDESKLINPLFIPATFEHSPHIYFTHLLSQPEYFPFLCKYILNFELLPFQSVILKNLWTHKFPMMIASRGASKTTLLAVYSILRALLLPRRQILVTGSVFRQSKLIFEAIERIWNNAPMLRSMCENYPQIGPSKANDMWRFYICDSIITAIPLGSDGSSVRGLRANDILSDEFAATNVEIFETVISGFASVSYSPVENVKREAREKMRKTLGLEIVEEIKEHHTNQIVISGTADYEFNHFYNYFSRWHKIIESRGDRAKLRDLFGDQGIDDNLNWKDFCIMRFPVELIPEGFMDSAQLARSKATIHSGVFFNEYGAVFSADSNGFFKRTLIESCVSGKNDINLPISGLVSFVPTLRGSSHKKYVMGVDTASEKDNFAIVILEVHADHRRIVNVWTIRRKEQKEMQRIGLIKENDFYSYCSRKIRDLCKTFPCEEIAIDSQGGGITILERLSNISDLKPGEIPFFQKIEVGKFKETDVMLGKHIIEMVSFASSEWLSEANHGMRKDFEDRILLFPCFDNLSLGLAEIEDKGENRLYDTLEGCVENIEELKNELTTIVQSRTNSGRERFDTPETIEQGKKKGHMKKDRYSALLMANMSARKMILTYDTSHIGVTIGGFSNDNYGGDGKAGFTGNPILSDMLSVFYE